jgi:4-hydroxybenzoyl-CoA thioesterase
MAPFRAGFKVRFGDIDQAGIVYYPRFLHYFHIALEEFFSNELDLDYPTMFLKHRIGLPTVHVETDFRKPLRFGDHFEIEIRVLAVGSTSIKFGYTTYLAGTTELLVDAHNITVCLDMITFEKRETPKWLREKLTDYQKRCDDGV